MSVVLIDDAKLLSEARDWQKFTHVVYCGKESFVQPDHCPPVQTLPDVPLDVAQRVLQTCFATVEAWDTEDTATDTDTEDESEDDEPSGPSLLQAFVLNELEKQLNWDQFKKWRSSSASADSGDMAKIQPTPPFRNVCPTPAPTE